MTRRAREGLLIAMIAGLSAIGAVAALGLYIWGGFAINASYAPPNTVTTFDEFIQHYGEPNYLKLVRGEGMEFLIADISPRPVAIIYVPSGGPAYVFDKQGKLIDWRPESGEGGWENGGNYTSSYQKEVTLTEAKNWVQP